MCSLLSCATGTTLASLWPYGRITDADAGSLKAVETGRLPSVLGVSGSRDSEHPDRFRIPRNHFEVHWPLQHVKCFAHGAMEK